MYNFNIYCDAKMKSGQHKIGGKNEPIIDRVNMVKTRYK